MSPIETDINALPGLDWRVRRVLEKIVENQNAIIKKLNSTPKFSRVVPPPIKPKASRPQPKKKKQ